MVKMIRTSGFGGAEVLESRESDRNAVGSGEVRIVVEAAGVGLVDVMQRSGAYPGVEANFVPGLEVAGRITEVGDGVAPDMVGKIVYAMLASGGYSQEVVTPAVAVVPLPDGVSAVDAVALGINAAVAYRCVEVARVSSGQNVLVRGAGGGIGVHVVQAAKDRGAAVTVLTSSAERGKLLQGLGACQVIDRTAGVIGEDKAFDVIIDPVGGAEVPTMVGALAPNGYYVLCGGAAGFPAPDFGLPLLMNFQKSLTISAVSLSSLSLETLLSVFSSVFEAFTQKRIASVVADVLPLEAAPEAHRRIEAGEVFGKIILKP
ncbi:zinc-binding alcohol dehydrogenase family protein [Sphingobium sp. B2]|uniref:quinone oxidoreductase family protein n=1 Tax=Sphingobium sp. B2 TaxID=2583228 RepID=UPI0011A95509|nr:zinc-binding dehydrogenase [Sphingobium sp. B2]